MIISRSHFLYLYYLLVLMCGISGIMMLIQNLRWSQSSLSVFGLNMSPIFVELIIIICLAGLGLNLIWFIHFEVANAMTHSTHALLLTSLAMIFCSKSSHPKRADIPLYAFEMSIVLIISPYFFAGLWKLRTLLPNMSFTYARNSLLEHLAWTQLDGSFGLLHLMTELAQSQGSLLAMGLLGVMCLQLCAPAAIFFRRTRPKAGILILLFHCANLIVLGVPYTFNMATAALFLFFNPFPSGWEWASKDE